MTQHIHRRSLIGTAPRNCSYLVWNRTYWNPGQRLWSTNWYMLRTDQNSLASNQNTPLVKQPMVGCMVWETIKRISSNRLSDSFTRSISCSIPIVGYRLFFWALHRRRSQIDVNSKVNLNLALCIHNYSPKWTRCHVKRHYIEIVKYHCPVHVIVQQHKCCNQRCLKKDQHSDIFRVERERSIGHTLRK